MIGVLFCQDFFHGNIHLRTRKCLLERCGAVLLLRVCIGLMRVGGVTFCTAISSCCRTWLCTWCLAVLSTIPHNSNCSRATEAVALQVEPAWSALCVFACESLSWEGLVSRIEADKFSMRYSCMSMCSTECESGAAATEIKSKLQKCRDPEIAKPYRGIKITKPHFHRRSQNLTSLWINQLIN